MTKQKEQLPEVKEEAQNAERVYVTFTDDFVVSDNEKELVITINVEFAFDVPVDGSQLDNDNVVMVSNSATGEFFEDDE